MVAMIQPVAMVTKTLKPSDSVLTQLRATAWYLTLVNIYNTNNTCNCRQLIDHFTLQEASRYMIRYDLTEGV